MLVRLSRLLACCDFARSASTELWRCSSITFACLDSNSATAGILKFGYQSTRRKIKLAERPSTCGQPVLRVCVLYVAGLMLHQIECRSTRTVCIQEAQMKLCNHEMFRSPRSVCCETDDLLLCWVLGGTSHRYGTSEHVYSTREDEKRSENDRRQQERPASPGDMHISSEHTVARAPCTGPADYHSASLCRVHGSLPIAVRSRARPSYERKTV
jgi:hypothetical protein